jgi:hypothetical protein
MLPFEDRYTRQRQLPEVGLAGQEQIARLTALLPEDACGAFAAIYLQRAGAKAKLEGTVSPVTFPHEGYFRWETARDLAAGSHLALALIRRQLGL